MADETSKNKVTTGQRHGHAVEGYRVAQEDVFIQSKKGKTQSWQEIYEVVATARHFAKVYTQACDRMVRLSAPSAVMKCYQVLEKEHLNVTTIAIDPSQRGTRHGSLAWFWSLDVQGDINQVDGMAECKSIISCTFILLTRYIQSTECTG